MARSANMSDALGKLTAMLGKARRSNAAAAAEAAAAEDEMAAATESEAAAAAEGETAAATESEAGGIQHGKPLISPPQSTPQSASQQMGTRENVHALSATRRDPEAGAAEAVEATEAAPAITLDHIRRYYVATTANDECFHIVETCIGLETALSVEETLIRPDHLRPCRGCCRLDQAAVLRSTFTRQGLQALPYFVYCAY